MPRPSLKALDTRIRALTGESQSSRPFLCDGSPFGCEIATVGINPGSEVPLWPYWSVPSGCNKAGWFAKHRELYGRRKSTRERLERFIAAVAPYRVLELNLYDEYSPELKSLEAAKRRTSVFDYMLGVGKPRVVLVHGDDPRSHLEALLSCSLATDCFTKASYRDSAFLAYAASKHFRRASYADVEGMAITIKARLARSAT